MSQHACQKTETVKKSDSLMIMMMIMIIQRQVLLVMSPHPNYRS